MMPMTGTMHRGRMPSLAAVLAVMLLTMTATACGASGHTAAPRPAPEHPSATQVVSSYCGSDDADAIMDAVSGGAEKRQSLYTVRSSAGSSDEDGVHWLVASPDGRSASGMTGSIVIRYAVEHRTTTGPGAKYEYDDITAGCMFAVFGTSGDPATSAYKVDIGQGTEELESMYDSLVRPYGDHTFVKWDGDGLVLQYDSNYGQYGEKVDMTRMTIGKDAGAYGRIHPATVHDYDYLADDGGEPAAGTVG